MLRRLVAMVCVLVAWASLASPAAGHVAIRVLITFPQPGERVGPHTELRVYAQPFLGGVDATTFTVELDGRPLNAVGRLMRVATPISIRIEETKRIPLHDLSEGDHTVTLSYRPDTDEPAAGGSVTFVVDKGGPSRVLVAAAIVGAAILVLAGLRSFRAPKETDRQEEQTTPGEAVRPEG
jgi:hypothetical protein